jgi:hypothetical protein
MKVKNEFIENKMQFFIDNLYRRKEVYEKHNNPCF